MDELTSQYERVQSLLDDPSRSKELKTTANAVLHQIRPDYYQIQETKGRTDHLLAYIKREAAKYRASDVDDVPYDSLRPSDEPLCTCRSQSCPLQQGQLPARLKNSDDLARDLRDYRHSHAGDPRVLMEADEAWREKIRRVDDALTLLVVSLRNEVPFEDLEGSDRFTDADGEVRSRADDIRQRDAEQAGGGRDVEA